MRISDAAKRINDTYQLHRTVSGYDAIGKWFAARLLDGTTDGVLYDSKRDAVTHQHHNEKLYAYIQIVPGSKSVQEFQAYLDVTRRYYDKGLTLTDPDHQNGGLDMIRRTTREDEYSRLRALFIGDRPPSNITLERG